MKSTALGLPILYNMPISGSAYLSCCPGGMQPQAATLVLLFFGGGGAVGVIAGGAAGQWLYNKKKVGACLTGAAHLPGCPPCNT